VNCVVAVVGMYLGRILIEPADWYCVNISGAVTCQASWITVWHGVLLVR